MQFIEDLPLEERIKYAKDVEKRHNEFLKQQAIFLNGENPNIKYRCEQTVITKLNGITASTATTKTDYLVNKSLDENNNFIVSVSVADNIVNMFPAQYEEAIQLVCDFDCIKSDVALLISPKTGKISKIRNQKEIIEKWKDLRSKIRTRFSFMDSKENKENLDTFLSTGDSIVSSEEKLLEDLKLKMFFFLFFDKYLISEENIFENYQQNIYSQLFNNINTTILIDQKITNQSETEITVSKKGIVEKDERIQKNIEKIYDTKYKPVIGYKFSEYNVSCWGNTVFDAQNKCIKTAEINIEEGVANNIELGVYFKLRKIE